VRQVDIVEISPGVLNADWLFNEDNYRVLEDPRVRTYVDDAQSFLRAAPDLYDLIISEPSNPWVAGIAGLFTREFFEEMSGKLNPDGLAVVWFHAYEQSEEGVNLVMRTIDSVFPHVIVGRSPDYFDIIIIASNDPIEPDFEAMEDSFDQPAVRNDLGRIGVPNLASLLFMYTITSERLDKILPPGPLNTIAHQRLEYSAPVSHFYDESSSFLKRNDPLLHGAPSDAKILGDYIKYRATAGEPVHRFELENIIRRAYKKRATSILRGLPLIEDSSAQPPNRSARGLVPEAANTGWYEAGYWNYRFRKAGKPDLALPYSQRLQALEDATKSE